MPTWVGPPCPDDRAGVRQGGRRGSLIFDGAGTHWAAELVKEENKLHPAFEKVRDEVAGACYYCAGAFEVREDLEKSGVPLLREHKGHPSVRGLVADGYEVITF